MLEAFSTSPPPSYLTSGDLAAIQWISNQPGNDIVLARSDLSPWVAAKAHHRVLVGHYLWNDVGSKCDFRQRSRPSVAIESGTRAMGVDRRGARRSFVGAKCSPDCTL
jgi:hypothetical protein